MHRLVLVMALLLMAGHAVAIRDLGDRLVAALKNKDTMNPVANMAGTFDLEDGAGIDIAAALWGMPFPKSALEEGDAKISISQEPLVGSPADVAAAALLGKPDSEDPEPSDQPRCPILWDVRCGFDVMKWCGWHPKNETEACLREHKDQLNESCGAAILEQEAFMCGVTAIKLCGHPHSGNSSFIKCLQDHSAELEKVCPSPNATQIDPTLFEDFKCGATIETYCHDVPDFAMRDCLIAHGSENCRLIAMETKAFDCGVAASAHCGMSFRFGGKPAFMSCLVNHRQSLEVFCGTFHRDGHGPHGHHDGPDHGGDRPHFANSILME
eukprot:jgi/Mesvir1/7893/Mv11825-RA.1